LLIVGLHADVETALARLGLPARPAQLQDRGSAQVWAVVRKPGETPVAVISARDAKAIAALERPLPHYGSQSFLAFEGRRAVVRGVWPAGAKAVPVKR
jgi:aminopeptidase N